MILKSIESIKDFGVFNDFSGSDIKEFSENNIIFGWNYSGKTTLSRLFRCLEMNKRHEDYRSVKFRIKLDNDNIITERGIQSNKLAIRVFNSDYIKENLCWDQSDNPIKPILIVGRKNIELQNLIKKHESEKEKLVEVVDKKEAERRSIQNNLNNILTQEARRITEELSLLRNFRRPELLELLDNMDVSSWVLPEEVFLNTKKAVLTSEEMAPLKPIYLNVNEKIIIEVKELLTETATPTITIEKLKNNYELEKWVREGLKLHTDINVCQFCNNAITEEVLNALYSHFSSDYEDFRSKIEKALAYLESNKVAVDLKNKNDFYPDLHSDYVAICERIEECLNAYNETIDCLIAKTNEKLSRLTEKIDTKDLNNNYTELSKHVDNFNELIIKHNHKTKNFGKEKEQSKEKLKKHYAARFFIDSKYAEERNKIADIEKELEGLRNKATKKKNEIVKLSQQVSEEIKGAEKVTFYMNKYFGLDSPITMKKFDDKGFQVYRGGKIAKNLSEGEKTAISFSHFLACLEDKETKSVLQNTIIYVDDPVSSLDSNHLFNTYALISTYLINKCGQLFISTHNYELFNLLKDELTPYKPKKCKYETRDNSECNVYVYQVEKIAGSAELKNVDCLLCRFKSEYQFVFYQIYRNDDDASDQALLYLMPNLLRRFLEGYLSFRYPSKKKFNEKLKEIISDPDDLIFVHKIVDEISHNENTARSLKLYKTDEIKRATEIVFDNIEAKDPGYLSELKNSVGLL